MSVALAQKWSTTSWNSGASAQSAAAGSPCVVGDIIFVRVANFRETIHVSQVQDTLGNVYSKLAGGVVNAGSNGGNCEIWSAPVTVGGSNNKITVTLGASSLGSDFSSAEFSGLGATPTLDGSAVVNSANSTTPAVGSWTTTNANDLLLIGFYAAYGGNISAFNPPTNFLEIAQDDVGGKTISDFCYEIVSATQSGITPSWGAIVPSSSWVTLAVAVKAAAGGGIPFPLLLMAGRQAI